MFNILPLHMYAWSYTYWISLCIVTVRIWFFLIMSFMSQKSKVTFTLNKYTKFLFVYEWLKSLWFSNGYALNIARLVNLREHRLYRMKSMTSMCLCEHLFYLIIWIYFQKRYEIHWQRLITFLGIKDIGLRNGDGIADIHAILSK